MVIKEEISIQTPLDLANALGEHLLVVGENGRPAPGSEVPDEIHARYDMAQQLLFINNKVIDKDLLAAWRKEPFYCGSLQRRLGAGSGNTEKPLSVSCFDLSDNPSARTARIQRRGKPLLVERVRERLAASEKMNTRVYEIHKRVAELKEQWADHPLLEEALAMLDEGKEALSLASKMLVEGKRRGPDKHKRPKRSKTPPEEQIKLEALDTFLADNVQYIHRILRKTVEEDGRPRWVEKDIRPEAPPERWVGRYEDVKDPERAPIKQLFIPLALLKAMGGFEDHKKDYRYVGRFQKRIGAATAYCVAFDFTRTWG